MTHKTTLEVCDLLGITPAALNSWLSRHEQLKPRRRERSGFLWTDQEIAAVQSARAIQPTNPTSRNTAAKR